MFKAISLDEVEPSSLARLWEASYHIREKLRIREDDRGNKQGGRLVTWPDPKHKVASMAAIAMNIYALKTLAKWWCPQESNPKSPSVKIIRKQVMD